MAAMPLTREELRSLAAAGGAAPSLHNSQPWRFRPVPGATALEVYADLTRAVPLTDPQGRALHLSVGAAVLNIRCAAAHHGRTTRVQLTESRDDSTPVAVLEFGDLPTGAAPLPEAALYPAVHTRHSSRQPYSNRDVPEQLIAELIRASAAEGARLDALEEAETRRLLAVTAEAERRVAADSAREAEVRGWVRLEAGTTDGIPLAALGPLDRDARVPVRSFTGHPPRPSIPSERFEALPQLATLSTHDDRPADWLRAGQAMERVWLLLTVHGLRASVLHQAVEWADTRWQLRNPDSGPEFVQILLRWGYGPPGAPTPRRPVEEILDLSEPAAAPGQARAYWSSFGSSWPSATAARRAQ